MEDFRACARVGLMKRGRAEAILEETREAVARWPQFAAEAAVPEEMRERIRNAHRLEIR